MLKSPLMSAQGVFEQAPANPDGVDTYIHMYYNAGWQVTCLAGDVPGDVPVTLGCPFCWVRGRL